MTAAADPSPSSAAGPAADGSVSRRRALLTGAALGVGAVITACSSSGSGGDAPASSPDPSGSTASAGSTDTARVTGAPSCILAPEETEGPFYLDLDLVRRDITEGRPGTPLELALTVVDADTCEPIVDATVDVWHCDAGGDYSGFAAGGGGEGTTFLRGVQPTDASGVANVSTIYPGWYQGRTTHIHLKVHTGGRTVHTGQLYFDEAVTESVYAGGAYVEHGPKDTSNAADAIFGDGGAESMLTLTGSGDGYVGAITVGVRR